MNLIGEHTDYNDGFVLPWPSTADRWSRSAARDGRAARALAATRRDATSSPLDAHRAARTARRGPTTSAGVAWALRGAGHRARAAPTSRWRATCRRARACRPPRRWRCASARALRAVCRRSPGRRSTVARSRQRAENEFVGIAAGSWTSYRRRAARAGHALLLDCRSLETRPVPLPRGTAMMVVIDSGVRRGLAGGDYNDRRAPVRGGGASLRRAGAARRRRAALDARAASSTTSVLRRARHVVTENAARRSPRPRARAGDLAASGG